MANPDKPNGFRPVRKIDGGMPWNDSYAQPAYLADADDESATVGPGTALFFEDVEGIGTGLASHWPSVRPMFDEDISNGWGVCVGVSKPTGTLDPYAESTLMVDLANLNPGSHATAAEAEADEDGVVIWAARANEWVFRVQMTETAEAVTIGNTISLTTEDSGSGTQNFNANTGQSTSVLGVTSEGGGDEVQFRIVGIPAQVDNDPELADTDVEVVFVDQWPYSETG
jgi:hypothetical protein